MSEAEEIYTRKFSYSVTDASANNEGVIDSGGMPNKNTEWLQNPFTWVIYLGFCAGIWGAVHLTGFFTLAESLTITNVLHGVVTFIFFHWIKGSPDEFSQGEWNGLTFWEQLDAGLPYTPSKKFLMLVPAVLCLPALMASDYELIYLAVNLPVFIVLETAKLPSMHRVRILSINATAGIDDMKKYR